MKPELEDENDTKVLLKDLNDAKTAAPTDTVKITDESGKVYTNF